MGIELEKWIQCRGDRSPGDTKRCQLFKGLCRIHFTKKHFDWQIARSGERRARGSRRMPASQTVSSEAGNNHLHGTIHRPIQSIIYSVKKPSSPAANHSQRFTPMHWVDKEHTWKCSCDLEVRIFHKRFTWGKVDTGPLVFSINVFLWLREESQTAQLPGRNTTTTTAISAKRVM